MAQDKSKLHPETLAAQGLGRIADPYRDIVPPIYVSTTYERGADGAFPEHGENPFEILLAHLIARVNALFRRVDALRRPAEAAQIVRRRAAAA